MRELINTTIMNKDGAKCRELHDRVIGMLDAEPGNVQLDFRGVQLNGVEGDDFFRQLVINNRVFMKFYTNKELVNVCKILCSLETDSQFIVDGVPRIVNEDIMIAGRENPDAVKRRNMVGKVKSSLPKEGAANYDPKAVTIKVNPIVNGNLVHEYACEAIFEVVRELCEKREAGTKIVLDLHNTAVGENIMKEIAGQIRDLREKGHDVSIVGDKNTVSVINPFIVIGQQEMTLKDRAKIVKEHMPNRIVGVLSKFRVSRSTNITKRLQEPPLMSRVAIYLGMEGRTLRFVTFKLDTFMTKADYYYSNDEILEQLESEVIDVDLGDIGIMQYSIGRKWHFNMPYQITQESKFTTWVDGPDGRKTRKEVLMPVYIKKVLDDFGIGYNFEELMKAIHETREYLGVK